MENEQYFLTSKVDNNSKKINLLSSHLTRQDEHILPTNMAVHRKTLEFHI